MTFLDRFAPRLLISMLRLVTCTALAGCSLAGATTGSSSSGIDPRCKTACNYYVSKGCAGYETGCEAVCSAAFIADEQQGKCAKAAESYDACTYSKAAIDQAGCSVAPGTNTKACKSESDALDACKVSRDCAPPCSGQAGQGS